MTQEMFVVNEDSTIEIVDDIDDDEIINMIGSDYFPAIFRRSTYGIEYAFVDLIKSTVEWIEAKEKS